MPTLDRVSPGQRVRIEAIDGEPELVQRLMEFGLLEGETIAVIGFAPLGDPLEILVGDARLSLRKREAAGITVALLD
jgi:ferrous iron transport protein A